MPRTFSAIIIGLLLTAVPSGAADERPPADPVARKTWRAQQLQERRAAQRAPQSGELPARAMELRGPLPLPARIVGGTPAGGNCEADQRDCRLEMVPPAGQVLVVTSLWSATRAVCDGLTLSATPPNGAPIAPYWRCEQKLTINGPGAGYTGFIIPK